MNKATLDKDLSELIEKRIQLSKMSYSDDRYDELEDELHDLEDEFVDNHGDLLEDAFADVHDEYCPDDDVLLPTAYLAKNYMRLDTVDGTTYDVPFKEGVMVGVDDYPNKDTRLVLLAKPTRILLTIARKEKHVVWTA